MAGAKRGSRRGRSTTRGGRDRAASSPLARAFSAIAEEDSVDAVLPRLCEALTGGDPCVAAWAAVFDEEGRLEAAAECGVGPRFDGLRKALEEGERPRVVKRALSGGALRARSLADADCAEALLDAEGEERACVVAPVEFDGRRYGLLALAASATDDKDVGGLATEAAELLAFVLHHLGVRGARERAEGRLEDRALDLAQRAKELKYVYAVSRLFEQFGMPLEKLLQAVVDLIPLASTRPEAVGARIALGDREYRTDNYRPTRWMAKEDIPVRGQGSGTLEICNLNANSDTDVDPFIREERALVGSIAKFLGSVIQRYEAEHELRSLLQLHQSTVETIPLWLLALDKDLKVLMANPQFLEATGRRLEEVVGHGLEDVMPPAILNGTPLVRKVEEAAETGGRDRLVNVRLPRPGRPDLSLNIHICGIPVDAEAPSDARSIVLVEDATRQRALERRLQQTARMEAVGVLADGIAHDFTNLLTSVKGYAGLVAAQLSEDSPLLPDVDRIRVCADRAGDVVAHLRFLSPLRSHERVVVDLNQVIRENLPLIRRAGERIEVEFAPGDDLGCPRVDPERMLQAFMGLMINARQSAPPDARARIETANVTLDERYAVAHPDVSPGEYVSATVTVFGLGPDQERLEDLAELRWTADSGDTRQGMGLFMANSIVEQNGGQMDISAAPEGGTAFRILLPRVADAVPVDTGKLKGRRRPGRREAALLVEDDENVLSVVRRILEINGFEVIPASSAELARELFHQRDRDIRLLVADVMLPGQSGTDLYEDLKREAPTLKALFMSGYADELRVDFGPLRDLPLIAKPFTPQSLMEKVREALGEVNA